MRASEADPTEALDPARVARSIGLHETMRGSSLSLSCVSVHFPATNSPLNGERSRVLSTPKSARCLRNRQLNN
jgi:hypothetical protein